MKPLGIFPGAFFSLRHKAMAYFGLSLGKRVNLNGKGAYSMNVLNERQAAERLGVRVQTMRNWRHLGKGPAYYKIGRTVRYGDEHVEDYKRACLVEPHNSALA